MAACNPLARRALVAGAALTLGTLGFAGSAWATPGNGNTVGHDAAAEHASNDHAAEPQPQGNGLGPDQTRPDQASTGNASTGNASNDNAGAASAPVLDQTAANPANQAPQPPSNADQSGHGANVGGAYGSTRNGAASANGTGNGTGRPCAGCVGKADNKNPAGQQPGGNDHNRGYECDGNGGVGRTNPAHTGCGTPPSTPPLPPTPPKPPTPPTPPTPPPPPPSCPHGHGQPRCGEPGDVPPVAVSSTVQLAVFSEEPATVLGTQLVTHPRVDPLAFTGLAADQLVLVGIGLLALGVIIVRKTSV